jgi:hypothetical protein
VKAWRNPGFGNLKRAALKEREINPDRKPFVLISAMPPLVYPPFRYEAILFPLLQSGRYLLRVPRVPSSLNPGLSPVATSWHSRPNSALSSCHLDLTPSLQQRQKFGASRSGPLQRMKQMIGGLVRRLAFEAENLG